jgi:hypothetical protein
MIWPAAAGLLFCCGNKPIKPLKPITRFRAAAADCEHADNLVFSRQPLVVRAHAGSAPLCALGEASATITLNANLQDLGAGGMGSRVALRLDLVSCPDGFLPRTSTGVIGVKSQSFRTDASGNVLGDAGTAGIVMRANDEVTCEAAGNSRYDIYIVYDRGAQFFGRYQILTSGGGTQDLKNLTSRSRRRRRTSRSTTR